ncbi:MAG: cell division protein ZapA [Acidobacteriota bacterium]
MKNEQLLELIILGQPYQVRVKGSAERAKKVSAIVNETMTTLQKGTHQSDTTRIAILAALNLADKLLTYIEKEQSAEKEVYRVSEEISEILDEAISDRKA